ncbi:hypothetical protein LBMAG56_05240 [Verrucomicrobiota bacterium]|nr:hypothetical protein LBMAG56_05240 [Verrucomicrobiota bacterium]
MNPTKFLSLAASLLIVGAPAVSAEDFHRAHKFETFAVGQWAGSDKSGLLKFGKDFGGGLGLGYNLTDHLNVNTDVVFSKVKIEKGSATFNTDATHISAHVNLDAYLFQGPIAPFLTGGVGVDNYDGSQGTISKSALSYKVGAGLRWDINSTFFAKAVYRTAWADIQNSERFHRVSVMFGVKF